MPFLKEFRGQFARPSLWRKGFLIADTKFMVVEVIKRMG